MQKRLAWLNDRGYIIDGFISHTRTTKFIMPLIGITEFDLKSQYKSNILINAHIKNIEEKLIYIILNKESAMKDSFEFLKLQNLNEHFVYYEEDEGEYILIYKLPSHFYDDYDKIYNGKYSETSIPYKEIMIRIYGVSRIHDDYKPSIYDCLFPTIDKKRLYAERLGVDTCDIIEVSSIPNLDYEIYKPIKELDNIL